MGHLQYGSHRRAHNIKGTIIHQSVQIIANTDDTTSVVARDRSLEEVIQKKGLETN